MISPLLLSTEVTVNNDQIVKTTANETELRNPNKGPMLIDEIRFLMRYRINPGGRATDLAINALIETNLTLGRDALTADFTPIWLLGRVIEEAAENQTDGIGVIPNLFNYVRTIWKFSRPLYIPENGYLAPQFRFNPFVSTLLGSNPATATVRCTYAGRSLSTGTVDPEMICIPYASAFVPAPVAGGSAAAQLDSNEAQLVNATAQDLKVTRFVGRVFGGQREMIRNESLTTDAAMDGGTLVRMTDSDGQIVVRDGTVFNHLFNYTDRSWYRRSVLRPRDYFIASLDQDYTAQNAGLLIQPMIGMLGWREVPLHDIG
jgi:hypothetical protein